MKDYAELRPRERALVPNEEDSGEECSYDDSQESDNESLGALLFFWSGLGLYLAPKPFQPNSTVDSTESSLHGKQCQV